MTFLNQKPDIKQAMQIGWRSAMKKQILIGVESFEEVIENNYFYIDKTLFIKELMVNKGKATLITRPRRFGKTLNMNMLKCFFDASRDNRHMFEGLKIMGCTDIGITQSARIYDFFIQNIYIYSSMTSVYAFFPLLHASTAVLLQIYI